ncbi:hypothetical protein DQ04_02171120 [Trypanosoma grayi]|uniref:hypothetical protein n=1 Tax=Trypanosoma grayi TaxID=71804 RepID=UPI0004F41606|nr:hypothetical protein DQ04_02171120 [Trypanosoma grayi]KEG11905.1 hypothetical protein DQ04_02171120 [Trypanosoma grayi]
MPPRRMHRPDSSSSTTATCEEQQQQQQKGGEIENGIMTTQRKPKQRLLHSALQKGGSAPVYIPSAPKPRGHHISVLQRNPRVAVRQAIQAEALNKQNRNLFSVSESDKQL